MSTANAEIASSPPSMQHQRLAGSKLRKELSGSLQESVSAPTSDFAKRQLEKMGWTAGTGLGKERNGMTSHLKVKKRQEGHGLGAEKHALQMQQASEDWWKSSLGDTLAKLGSSNNKKKQKDKKSGKKRSAAKAFTDEELFEATGGARFGMRAGKTRNLAKWKRTESSSSTATTTEESNRTESSTNGGFVSEKSSNSNVEKKSDDDDKSLQSSSSSLNEKDKKKKKRKKQDIIEVAPNGDETQTSESLQEDKESKKKDKKRSKKSKKKKTKKDKTCQ